MPPSDPIAFLIGHVAGVVEPIGVYAAQAMSKGTFFVSDAELDRTGHPACRVKAASRLGAEAA
jgi:hypothetical protein